MQIMHGMHGCPHSTRLGPSAEAESSIAQVAGEARLAFSGHMADGAAKFQRAKLAHLVA